MDPCFHINLINQPDIHTVLEPSGIPITGTPSISFITCTLWGLIVCYIQKTTISAHFQWSKWRTCYLFNKTDGVPVTGIPDGSRTVICDHLPLPCISRELLLPLLPLMPLEWILVQWFSVQWQTEVMHMSPRCISTGVLKVLHHRSRKIFILEYYDPKLDFNISI